MGSKKFWLEIWSFQNVFYDRHDGSKVAFLYTWFSNVCLPDTSPKRTVLEWRTVSCLTYCLFLFSHLFSFLLKFPNDGKRLPMPCSGRAIGFTVLIVSYDRKTTIAEGTVSQNVRFRTKRMQLFLTAVEEMNSVKGRHFSLWASQEGFSGHCSHWTNHPPNRPWEH